MCVHVGHSYSPWRPSAHRPFPARASHHPLRTASPRAVGKSERIEFRGPLQAGSDLGRVLCWVGSRCGCGVKVCLRVWAILKTRPTPIVKCVWDLAHPNVLWHETLSAFTQLEGRGGGDGHERARRGPPSAEMPSGRVRVWLGHGCKC